MYDGFLLGGSNIPW